MYILRTKLYSAMLLSLASTSSLAAVASSEGGSLGLGGGYWGPYGYFGRNTEIPEGVRKNVSPIVFDSWGPPVRPGSVSHGWYNNLIHGIESAHPLPFDAWNSLYSHINGEADAGSPVKFLYQSGKVYQDYRLEVYDPAQNYIYVYPFLRRVGTYDEDEWVHREMDGRWKCGDYSTLSSMPWSASCTGRKNRDLFSYDVYGANVVLQANPLPGTEKLRLLDISANGLVAVGDSRNSIVSGPKGASVEALALRQHGFPVADLDLNDDVSQFSKRAIKWTKMDGVEEVLTLLEVGDSTWVTPSWRSASATSVSDDGNTIVGNLTGYNNRVSYYGDVRMDEADRKWFLETNSAFVTNQRTRTTTELGEGTFAHGVSGDGSTVAGGVSGRWGEKYNIDRMRLPYPVDINGDFSLEKMMLHEGDLYPKIDAMRWTSKNGVELLKNFGDSDVGISGARVVSPNGKRIYRSLANGANKDGEVIVGFGMTEHGRRAFRWTKENGMKNLGETATWVQRGSTPYQINESVAEAVSGDGQVVVGGVLLESGKWRAFKWTEAQGIVDLGVGEDIYMNSFDNAQRTPDYDEESYAYDVSTDGRVIVGSTTDRGGREYTKAFIYSDWVSKLMEIPNQKYDFVDKMRDPTPRLMVLDEWMKWNGLSEWNRYAEELLETRVAYGTNADGSIVVGELKNGHGFLMYVVPGSGATGAQKEPGGMVDLTAAGEQMGVASTAQKTVLDNTQIIIHGAHSRPLSRRVKEGETTFWTTGDAGSGSGKYGNFRIAEVAASHNFGKVQAGMSVGKTWANNKDLDSVDVYRSSDFVTAELMAQVSGDLWMSVAGLYGDGQSKISRYDAGNDRTLYARPSNDTKWLSVRLELDDGIELPGGVYASPYGEVSYSEVKQAAYMESGGFGSASIDSMESSRTHLHIGADLRKPLNGNTSLIGLVEGSHLLGDDAAGLHGEVMVNNEVSIQLNTPATEERDHLVRVGFGFEHKLDAGAGKLSGMLNATNDGEDDNVWLSLSYQATF